jgi:urea carboxylase
MWNRDRVTREFSEPWLLRFFDQIRFYPVSADELKQIREDFPRGRYPLKIEESRFSLREYKTFLASNAQDITDFTERRDQAFSEELARWVESGQLHYEANQNLGHGEQNEESLPDQCVSIDSMLAGNVWDISVVEGQSVDSGDVLAVIESMKMEIQVTAPHAGRVRSVRRAQGEQVQAGSSLIWLEVTE